MDVNGEDMIRDVIEGRIEGVFDNGVNDDECVEAVLDRLCAAASIALKRC
jgi:hypothetical protein